MIAIQTKYLQATNFKGARIKATAKKFSVTILYPHELYGVACHFQAVKALVAKHELAWTLDNMRYGETDQGFVFCFDASRVGL